MTESDIDSGDKMALMAVNGDGIRSDKVLPVGRSWRLWALFITLAVAGCLGDLWSKHAVFNWVGSMEPCPLTGAFTKPVIPGVMHFTLSTNPGVVFGFDRIPRSVVVGASFVAFALVGAFFAFSPRNAKWTHLSLAMIMGGAAGNLYDRICSHVLLPGMSEPVLRQVRDFIDFSPVHIGPFNYPWIFNIADVLLVVGVGILMIISLFSSRAKKPNVCLDSQAPIESKGLQK